MWGHSVMLPLGSMSSPPCARVCCLHKAWRQLRELCRFPVLCFEFLLGNINSACLVFSLWAPAWSQHWTETMLSLFGCFGKIPDAGISVCPDMPPRAGCPTRDRLPAQGVPCPQLAPRMWLLYVMTMGLMAGPLLPG